MGHDIYGYKPSDTKKEVAYLRRGAFNPLKHTIYDALDCHECNGGVSGNGSEKEFTKDELIIALNKIDSSENFIPERSFLNDCIDNVDEFGKILIQFS